MDFKRIWKTMLMRWFGVRDPNYEYWVRTDEIHVPYLYTKAKIRKAKWERKLKYWYETGKFESKILIDKDFRLVDGYSSQKIAHVNGVKYVPVYFVD